MKSISIHKIDDQLMALIQKKAEEKGLSLNKTIKLLLREALGITQSDNKDNRRYFEQFLGVWNDDEYNLFKKNVEEFNSIDPEDWQ